MDSMNFLFMSEKRAFSIAWYPYLNIKMEFITISSASFDGYETLVKPELCYFVLDRE